MLASDVNNPQFLGPMDPDAGMIARFYERAVQNNFKTAQEGRPVFENRIYCEYYPAGSTLLKMDVPASEAHKQRFHRQWAFFENTRTGKLGEIGTPLEQWPILSPADVENLKALKFLTVDNIAAASDMQLQAIGMGAAGLAPHVLRARAQAYLMAAKDSALPQAQAQQIEDLKRQQAENDAKHAAEMAELRTMLEAAIQAKKDERAAKSERTPEQIQAARDKMAKARAGKGKPKHGKLDPAATG